MNKKIIIALLVLTMIAAPTTIVVAVEALINEIQAPFETTTVLHFDWDAGHRQIAVDQGTTVVSNEIVLQIRDAERNVVSEQRQSVPDCFPIHDGPGTGTCGTEVGFTTVLPHRGHWEKWVRGEWKLSDDTVAFYTVPVEPSLGRGGGDFSLIEILESEWYDLCPRNPPAPTPYPVQPTYTPLPTPTCLPTATSPPPLPTPTLYPTPTPWPTQPPLE
jgi:hypothetical protein